MVADILPVLISFLNSLNYSFISHFFSFWMSNLEKFCCSEKYNSSSNPCFCKIIRRLRVLETNPFVIELVSRSS